MSLQRRRQLWGCWLPRCRQLPGIPGAAVWGYNAASPVARLPGKQLPRAALLMGWVDSMSGLVDSLRDRQHKRDPGSRGWLRGRVSNREDSLVIIYVVWRKDLLGSCWQAGKGTKTRQPSRFKSSSGELMTESSVSATWCHMDQTEHDRGLPFPPLSWRSMFATAAEQPHQRLSGEGDQQGWAGVQAPWEVQAGTKCPFRHDAQSSHKCLPLRDWQGQPWALLLHTCCCTWQFCKMKASSLEQRRSYTAGRRLESWFPTPHRANFEQVLAHQDLHRFQLSRSSLGLLLPTACSLWYVPSPRMLSSTCFSYFFIISITRNNS